MFRSAVDRAGLAFVVECPPLDEPVYVDRDMWEKVVFNLLSNALKFTFDGAISISVRRAGHEAVITVATPESASPPRRYPRLFERFHRIEDARGRSNEGSGIGLALVKELVGLHGGSIDADSTEGVGTTFTIRLPFGTAHLPEDAVVASSAGAGGQQHRRDVHAGGAALDAGRRRARPARHPARPGRRSRTAGSRASRGIPSRPYASWSPTTTRHA